MGSNPLSGPCRRVVSLSKIITCVLKWSNFFIIYYFCNFHLNSLRPTIEDHMQTIKKKKSCLEGIKACRIWFGLIRTQDGGVRDKILTVTEHWCLLHNFTEGRHLWWVRAGKLSVNNECCLIQCCLIYYSQHPLFYRDNFYNQKFYNLLIPPFIERKWFA